jgi:chromosome segregation ATPase
MPPPSARSDQQPGPSGAHHRARQLRDEARDLSSEMQTLGSVIKDLEGQLDRLMSVNETLKQDLDVERQRRVELQGRVAQLQDELLGAQREIVDNENLAAEVAQLNQERARLAGAIRELEQQLSDARRERDRQQELIQRLRGSRADALEEVQSVESQFERAMQVVAQAKAELTIMTEERDALGGRLRVAEERLQQVEEERDVLVAEVDESRALLDEIRRSLVDACVVSTGTLPEQADAKNRRRSRG